MHGHLNYHLMVMGIRDDPTCNFCGMEEETSEHFLARCCEFSDTRKQIFKLEVLDDTQVSDINPNKILRFARLSGRFEVND